MRIQQQQQKMHAACPLKEKVDFLELPVFTGPILNRLRKQQ